MTQIEERAKKYCIDNYDLPPSRTVHAAMGYIQGATEQRRIDIDMACEWLKNTFEGGGYAQDWQITEFRKAMEE